VIGSVSTAPLRTLISESQNGLSKRAGDQGDELPVLRLADISGGAIDESAPRAIRLTEKERAKYELHRGDLLCIRVNGSKALVGRMVPFTSAHAWAYCDHFIRLRPDPEKSDFRYLAYFLNSAQVRRVLELGMVSSAGQHTVSQGTVLELDVPLLPMDRQREIVAEIEKQFSRLDDSVANLQRVKANLGRYRSAVLREAFSDRSQAWRWGTFSDAGEVTTGFTPATSEPANFGGDVPFFKPTDLDAGDNVRLAREYLTAQGLRQGRRLAVGSVLVTCIGATIGKTGLAQVECATNQQINAVSPHEGLIDARFLYWWTVSPLGRRQILDNSSATTLPIINKSKFSALSVPFPPLVEQHSIVAEVDRRLSIVREVEAEVDANLKRAQSLRQSVLQAAFACKLPA
jgi:type I restriction enzyme, S subunit